MQNKITIYALFVREDGEWSSPIQGSKEGCNEAIREIGDVVDKAGGLEIRDGNNYMTHCVVEVRVELNPWFSTILSEWGS